MDRIHALKANDRPIFRIPVEHSDLPLLSEINNLELTLFDNGRKKGRPRFALKAEVNVKSGKFADKRDFIAVADMYDSAAMSRKLSVRNISDDYRELIKTLLKQIASTGEAALVGMFARKGGKAGQTWFDRQFAVIYHNGEHVPLYADFCIGGDVHRTSNFDCAKHPMTGKAFALMNDGRRIAGKSIDVLARRRLHTKVVK